jgi:hypothetical protein
MEHHHLMEQAIGRAMAEDEVVHHFNSVKDDNELRNLFLTDRHKHPQLHAAQTRYCLAGHPPISEDERVAEPFLSWWMERHIWACEAPDAKVSLDGESSQ